MPMARRRRSCSQSPPRASYGAVPLVEGAERAELLQHYSEKNTRGTMGCSLLKPAFARPFKVPITPAARLPTP